MREELRQQLGDAQGFGEMQSIFAEAYQRSLGRSGTQIQKGQKALEELYKAMEKGNVYSAKVLPYVAEIAKQMASGGISEARVSAYAEKNRFFNLLTDGWKKFTEGGGANGIANFWKDMSESFGAWWNENAASLGKLFEKAVQWFKVFRIGLTDFVKYLWTGETNSFVNWLAQEKGIDASAIRVFLLDIYDLAKVAVKSVAQTIGLLDSEGKFNFNEFGNRVKNFLTSLKTAFTQIMEMFVYFGYGMERLGQLFQGGWTSLASAAIPGTGSNKLFSDAMMNFGHGFSKFAGATTTIGGAYFDAVAGGEPALKGPDQLQNKLTAMHIGTGSSGMSPRQHRLMYPELYDNSVQGFIAANSGGSGLRSDSKQQVDINLNLKVEGDPDVLKSIDADYLVDRIGKDVLGRVNYNLMSSTPDAPRY